MIVTLLHIMPMTMKRTVLIKNQLPMTTQEKMIEIITVVPIAIKDL